MLMNPIKTSRNYLACESMLVDSLNIPFVWLRGKIRVGEWCCEVVGSCEVQFSTSSQPDKNLFAEYLIF